MWNDVLEKEKDQFDNLATHPLQSFEWGEFRKKTGVKVIRKGFFEKNKLLYSFQLTIHTIPHAPWTIGYLPKTNLPTKEMISELIQIGKENNCIFIQLEPNIVVNQESRIKNQEDTFEKFKIMIHDSKFMIPPSAHPLFTKYTFVLDLTKTEDELLKNMHPKTRYNIKVAQKHGVIVKEEHSENAFNQYLQLTKETTNRKGFFAHTPEYHKKMWETLKSSNELSAHLLVAYYKKIPLTTWILFTFHDTLYYPYGASSSEHRETMASNLMMWEAIRFGKKLGLKKFDMWGSLGENPDPKDPWFGFHKFKLGYSPKLVEFLGSYDLVINPLLYLGYKIANKIRWLLVK